MTAARPTKTPTNASDGNRISPSGLASVAVHPNTAVTSSKTKRTAVAVIVPRTVIIPGRHGVTGPSSIRGPGADGGAQTSPPGLGGVGAAHPARSASNFFSFSSGFGTGHSLRRRRDLPPAEIYPPWRLHWRAAATSQRSMPSPNASRIVMAG